MDVLRLESSKQSAIYLNACSTSDNFVETAARRQCNE